MRAAPSPVGLADAIASAKPADKKIVALRPSRRAKVNVGAVIVALVAGVTIALVLANSTLNPGQFGAGPPPKPAPPKPPLMRYLTWNQLRSGDCLTGTGMGLGTNDPWPTYITQVACTKQHLAEVYFASDIWPQSLAAYPGVSKLRGQADERCDAALPSYTGIPYGINGGYAFDYHFVYPVPSAWASGSRLLVCVAYPYNEVPLDYSIRAK